MSDDCPPYPWPFYGTDGPYDPETRTHYRVDAHTGATLWSITFRPPRPMTTQDTTTTTLTLNLTRAEHQRLHEQNPGLVAAPVVHSITPVEIGMESAPLLLDNTRWRTRDGGPTIKLDLNQPCRNYRALSPARARQLARALIVAAGELEGREPESQLLSPIARDLPSDEKWCLGYLTMMLEAPYGS